jgi:two-component system chemotaxis response regulator CheB
MEYKDIVVVGASTGGIEALQVLVRGLPAEFKGTLFITLHTGAGSPNVLDKILNRVCELPVSNASEGAAIRPGRVFVAPSDHHLILEKDGHMRITCGPKENRFRPAIDPMFRSAAYSFGSRVVGVVLTGFLDDGTGGLWAVKERRGTAIVQHPEEATAPEMPLSAVKHVEVDHILKLADIPVMLVRLSNSPVGDKGVKPMPREMEADVKIAQEENALAAGVMNWGEPSVYACPECHGVLMQLKEGRSLRFRCHTGHAYSIESLLSEFNEKTEATLWNAIRALDETVLLLRRLDSALGQDQRDGAASALRAKADEAQRRSEIIRNLILHQEPLVPRYEAAQLTADQGAINPERTA